MRNEHYYEQGYIDALRPKPLLTKYAKNIYSQWGEDGIIDKMIEIMEIDDGIYMEIGSWDGEHLSNTANLRDKGWTGYLVEGDENKHLEAKLKFDLRTTKCICAFVDSKFRTIDKIAKENKLPKDIDLISIDIDSNDYYLFKSMKYLRPKIVICEYNPTIPYEVDLVPEDESYFGCSPKSLIDLAEKKGYKLVSATGTNCIFVLKKYFNLFSKYNTNPKEIIPREHITYCLTGYKGDYLLSRKPNYGFNYPSTQKFKRGDYWYCPKGFGDKIYKSLWLCLKNIKRSLGWK